MTENTESTYKVPLTEIVDILPHNNAHSLEVAQVYGFQVIVKKDQYKKGDKIIYVPVDSIINPQLEYHLFPEGSKIKLDKGRIKQIRIRGLASQGMLISIEDVQKVYNFTPSILEEDLKEKLNIIKYEPPKPNFQSSAGGGQKRNKPLENSNFQKYNGLTNIKWCPFMFQPGEIVAYQEKLHGSNTRFGLVPFEANTFLKKVKKFFGLAPKYEYVYGSNNVQLQHRSGYTGFYGEDVYAKVFEKVNAANKVKPNEVIYGELIGEGIQKNYDYGHKGEHHFVLFDVKIINEDGTQRWLNPGEVEDYATDRGFDFVPTVYIGPYSDLDHVKSFTLGNSVYCPKQKIREGVVVKALENYCDERGNKRALKAISEKYLDKDQTDFH